jgi:crotonobetainyl-CoA:carnitine CoA-transferase CaiB-like acyl-CoA transferase
VAAVLEGVKVIEVAGWTFVPAGGGVLADWGADVIKIEHPETGDPQRGLSIGTVGAKGAGGVSFSIEQPNRGKRSLGLNIATEEGRDPIVNFYKTADGRFVQLMMLQGDRFWHEVCQLIERPDLGTDERFATGKDRFVNRVECIQLLREAFAARPLTEWRERMAALKGAWAELGLDWDAIVALKLNNTVN